MDGIDLESVERLAKDIKQAAVTLSDDEARFLVDAYYMLQEQRIRADNQIRALSASNEPNAVLNWFAKQSETLENQVKRALDAYSAAHPVGEWMRAQVGIGPVIAAGLLAHIDISRAQTAGDIWNFAGLNPGVEWAKGERRPWNASLKTICWKIGESFVKFSGRDDCFYGHFYAKKKLDQTERNEKLEFADQAAQKLERFKIGKDTDAYKSYIVGKLPPAHIHARAKRLAVKLFLSHLHHVWFEIEFGKPAPEPYAIAILDHGHYIPPPLYESALAVVARAKKSSKPIKPIKKKAEPPPDKELKKLKTKKRTN
jgi:hypothetical protein